MRPVIDDIVDLDRYPLDQLESPEGQTLVSYCREEMALNGMFNLVGLIRGEIMDQVVREVTLVIQSSAFTHRSQHNIYFLPKIEGLDPEHPALQQFETVNHTICADQIPYSALITIYNWPPFVEFLAEVMEKPALYPMDDPLACLNVIAYRDGEALGWHFDRSEFTTTLLLQAPEQGGEFEYRTGLRDENNPNYGDIGAFLQSNSSTKKLLLHPGTLNVFRGRNTLHRVTPIQGARERIIAIFSYFDRPSVRFTDKDNLRFYGRTCVSSK